MSLSVLRTCIGFDQEHKSDQKKKIDSIVEWRILFIYAHEEEIAPYFKRESFWIFIAVWVSCHFFWCEFEHRTLMQYISLVVAHATSIILWHFENNITLFLFQSMMFSCAFFLCDVYGGLDNDKDYVVFIKHPTSPCFPSLFLFLRKQIWDRWAVFFAKCKKCFH